MLLSVLIASSQKQFVNHEVSCLNRFYDSEIVFYSVHLLSDRNILQCFQNFIELKI